MFLYNLILSDITTSQIFTPLNMSLCCPHQINLILAQLRSITFSSSKHLSSCVHYRLQILYTILMFLIYIIRLLTKLLRGGFTMHVFIFVYHLHSRTDCMNLDSKLLFVDWYKNDPSQDQLFTFPRHLSIYIQSGSLDATAEELSLSPTQLESIAHSPFFHSCP